MTPSGIEIGTFRFVAQYLKHCATACPQRISYKDKLNFTFLLLVFLILLHISTSVYIIEGNKIAEQSNEIFVLK
jgi:hypothetical protein